MSRPLVLWKYAASLDGRIAARDGSSKWITSEESRADVHRLRAELDAIMVGSGTLTADDPSLTVRQVQGRQPLRVVVDSNARTPADARVLDHAAPTSSRSPRMPTPTTSATALSGCPGPSVAWICPHS
jgi:diaminohydroxyphosphoribosylaminopyrimidine deaminase/5-amino-6-(5-phosphoribosylamino)uracil reductase